LKYQSLRLTPVCALVQAMAQAFLPLLRKSQGRIINIGSVAGHVTFARYGAYSASKHALEAMTDGLRTELGPQGISVSLLEPGFMKTELFAKSDTGDASAAGASKVKPEVRETYPYLYSAKFEKKAQAPKDNGSDPVIVLYALHHAISSAFPRSRYPIGRVNRMPVPVLIMLRPLIPDRVWDKAVL
jgi:NAD(P)-dependent dehydrogenase (short-subunit alcohol dehydrogenase family)